MRTFLFFLFLFLLAGCSGTHEPTDAGPELCASDGAVGEDPVELCQLATTIAQRPRGGETCNPILCPWLPAGPCERACDAETCLRALDATETCEDFAAVLAACEIGDCR